ncbi:hypothetical protein FACS1894166_11460 [Bacilli bacterium]|nr:hypothetical protein FACS1894166_11460 [Bacilli bacterium]
MFFDYSTNAYSNNTIVKMFQYNNPTDFLVGRDRLPNVDATEKEINTAIQEGEEIIEDMVIQLSGEHGPLFDLMECPNPKNPEEMVYDTDEFLELQTKFQSDLKKLIIENGMGLKDYAHNRWYRPGNNVFDKVDRRATIMYNKIANQFSDKINPYIIKNKQK